MPATALEQMILELVNRARLDPAAEAARDGIALNEGVPANETISTVSKQPLAMNETLLGVARVHSQDMIDRDYFAHDTPEGVSPFQRMTNAGYAFTTAGENIAFSSTSGTVTQQMTIDLHRLLFVDAGISGRGHRINILDGSFQEVGVGQVTGDFQGRNATMLTEDFGTAGSKQFLTGVSYADADHDNFYSVGEGRNAMSIAAASGPATSTAGAGGYALQIGAGMQTITFSGGGLAAPITVAVTIAANTNAKVDVVDQGVIQTSASLTDLGGASRIVGLGTVGLTLTGDGGDDTIVGAKGNDALNGSGGTDFLSGNAGGDRFVFDSAALVGAQAATPVFDHVTDYDQGNSGAFTAGEGDQVDLSALLSAAFNHGNGQPATSLARAITSGTGAAVQIDADGAANGANWITIAQLDGVHAGNGVNVILDPSQPAGTSILVDAASPTPTPPPAGGGGSAFVASLLNTLHRADLNGDHTDDMLWLNDDGRVATWLMSNAQVSSAPTIGSAPVGWTFTGSGDMNGDGKDDLLWLNADGRVAAWLVNGSQVSSAPTIGSAPVGWHLAGIADVNGDARDDILWRNDDGRMATWLVNNGQVTSAPTIGSAPVGWHFGGSGDLNGDGKDDLLWLNDDGRVAAWLVDGAQVTAAPTIGSAPAGWHFAGTTDLNGDGKDDILWLNDDGRVASWLINNVQVASAPTIGSAPAGWHFGGTADVNGDHKTDILWSNDDGRMAAWLVDGDHVASAPTLGSTPGGWHIGDSHFDLV